MKKINIAYGLALAGILLNTFVGKSNHVLAKAVEPGNPSDQTVADAVAGPAKANIPRAKTGVAPFIVQDTGNDSPGTNIVTRIVTFTALIGGTPPPQLQWKVDKGAGFTSLAGATNRTFRIGNAQVSDSGFYALFATNSAGGLHTVPQQTVIIEGED